MELPTTDLYFDSAFTDILGVEYHTSNNLTTSFRPEVIPLIGTQRLVDLYRVNDDNYHQHIALTHESNGSLSHRSSSSKLKQNQTEMDHTKRVLFDEILFFNHYNCDFYNKLAISLGIRALTPLHYVACEYLANLNPAYITKLFDLTKCDVSIGKYVVRLFIEDKWTEVEVDDFIPVLKNSKKPLFYLPSTRHELWMLVLEKALAKVLNGYINLFDKTNDLEDLALLFAMLTGYRPQIINKEDLDSKLKNHLPDTGSLSLNLFTFFKFKLAQETQIQDNSDFLFPMKISLSSSHYLEKNLFTDSKVEEIPIQEIEYNIDYKCFNSNKRYIYDYLYSRNKLDQIKSIRKVISIDQSLKNPYFDETISNHNQFEYKAEYDYIQSYLLFEPEKLLELGKVKEEELTAGLEILPNLYNHDHNVSKIVVKEFGNEINQILTTCNDIRLRFKEKFAFLLTKARYNKNAEDNVLNPYNKALYINTLCDEESIESLRSSYSRDSSVYSTNTSGVNLLRSSYSVGPKNLFGGNRITEGAAAKPERKRGKKPKHTNIKVEDIVWKVRQYDNGGYIGELNENNNPDGLGGYFWDSGEIYLGTWKDGERNGFGTQFYQKDSKLYEGEYKNGMRYGLGIIYLANNDYYEGEFVDDYYDGQGTYFWANGAKWVGSFREGGPHGRGLLTTDAGLMIVKSFEHGKPIKASEEPDVDLEFVGEKLDLF